MSGTNGAQPEPLVCPQCGGVLATPRSQGWTVREIKDNWDAAPLELVFRCQAKRVHDAQARAGRHRKRYKPGCGALLAVRQPTPTLREPNLN